MAATLSEGFVSKLYTQKYDSSAQPTLQIKKLELDGKKHRGEVSDGTHFMPATFASQLTQTFKDEAVEKNTIFTAVEFSVIDVMGETTLQVFDAANFIPETELAGAPKDIRKASSTPAKGKAVAPSSSSSINYQPIASLNPYQSTWTIKGRITKKGDMRTFQNNNGSGKLFSVDILDEQGGQIKATMFGEAADKYFPVFQEGQVYTIGRGTLKLANKRYSNLPNDYEMSLNQDSEVHLCGDDAAIKSQHYSFTPIDALPSVEANEFVDVVGVVYKFSPVTQLVSQRTSKQLTKRNITLLDSSLMTVELTCWGEKAEEMTDELLETKPIIAVKAVKVSEFGGRTLNSSYGSQFHVNPKDVPEAVDLMHWYQAKGKDAQVESISNKGPSGTGKGGDPRKMLKSIEEERLGFGEKPDYFTVLGTITMVKQDPTKPPYYPSCASEGCNKKVVQDEGRGGWVCERCDKTFAEPLYRYILSFQASDSSGQAWLTSFNDTAEYVVGSKASEMQALLADGKEKDYKNALKAAHFKQYVLKCRCKAESNPKDGEMRVRTHVMTATPVDFVRESKLLIEEIATYNEGENIAMVA